MVKSLNETMAVPDLTHLTNHSFNELRSRKRLADIVPPDPFRLDRALQSFHRLRHPFAAEGERLEMDGEKIVRAGVIRHLHRLFRGAMRLNPRLIGADRHD